MRSIKHIITEAVISKFSETLKADLSLVTTDHAEERKDRDGNVITNKEIIDVVNVMKKKLAYALLYDILKFEEEFVILNKKPPYLNLACVTRRQKDKTIGIVIITAMKKQNFRPKT